MHNLNYSFLAVGIYVIYFFLCDIHYRDVICTQTQGPNEIDLRFLNSIIIVTVRTLHNSFPFHLASVVVLLQLHGGVSKSIPRLQLFHSI